MTRIGLVASLALASLTTLTAAPPTKFGYYLTGNAANVQATTTFGLGLMGGGTDVDALFTWMSARAGWSPAPRRGTPRTPGPRADRAGPAPRKHGRSIRHRCAVRG